MASSSKIHPVAQQSLQQDFATLISANKHVRKLDVIRAMFSVGIECLAEGENISTGRQGSEPNRNEHTHNTEHQTHQIPIQSNLLPPLPPPPPNLPQQNSTR